MPRKSWLNNRLHHADLSLQWKRRLFSINLKLIHSTQANYPVLSVKKARRSTPAETSRNHELEITLGHSDAQKAGKPLQDFQSGTIGLSRTTCSCFRGRTSAKTTGPKPQNPTKLQPYLENSQQSSYLYREVEDYRYNMHILPVQKIGKYT